jgi:hypothetical protein
MNKEREILFNNIVSAIEKYHHSFIHDANLDQVKIEEGIERLKDQVFQLDWDAHMWKALKMK